MNFIDFPQILIKCLSVCCPLNSHTPGTDQKALIETNDFSFQNLQLILKIISFLLCCTCQQIRHTKNINLTMNANTMTVNDHGCLREGEGIHTMNTLTVNSARLFSKAMYSAFITGSFPRSILRLSAKPNGTAMISITLQLLLHGN